MSEDPKEMLEKHMDKMLDYMVYLWSLLERAGIDSLGFDEWLDRSERLSVCPVCGNLGSHLCIDNKFKLIKRE